MPTAPDQLRPLTFEIGVNCHAEGSALIAVGETRVLCTASISEDVPPWLRGQGRGWITAEYGMLPRATQQRKPRDITRGRPDARGLEIQRLIGRSLRQAVDTDRLGQRTIFIDCDVLQADGGTRTAAITGGMVALAQALAWLKKQGLIESVPLRPFVAAVSVGIVGGEPILDLCYEEDARADVDMNIVMNADGKFIEIQGTAEREPFDRDQLAGLLDLVTRGIEQLIAMQQDALGPDIMAEIIGAGA